MHLIQATTFKPGSGIGKTKRKKKTPKTKKKKKKQGEEKAHEIKSQHTTSSTMPGSLIRRKKRDSKEGALQHFSLIVYSEIS